MKKCNICNKEKSLYSFYKNKTKKDDLQTYCKECSPSYGKILNCSECNSSFKIKHRNISKRKTSLCPDCLVKKSSERCKSFLADRNPHWRGGCTTTKKGYKYIRNRTEKHGYKLEHIAKMEDKLGRKLDTKKELVHHIDNDKTNNSIDNLYLTDYSKHGKIHGQIESIAFELYKLGYIKFDKEVGMYYLDKSQWETLFNHSGTSYQLKFQ